MSHCIAIDVSKQVLNVFDGERLFTVKNERGLKELKAYIEKYYGKNRKECKKGEENKSKGKTGYKDDKNKIDNTNIRKEFNKEPNEEFNDKKLKDCRSFYFVFEPTGVYSNYLKEFCINNKVKAYVINPKRSSNFAKAVGNRSKTDRTDAKMLYAFSALINDEEEVKVPDRDNVSDMLSVYLSVYQFVIKMKTSVSNRIHMLGYTNIDSFDKSVISSLKKELKEYERLKRDIIKKMEKVVKSNKELKEKYESLLTIPGIGRASAVSLISLFLKFKNTNRNEITALVGLDPVIKESGTSVRGKRKISKSGNKIIRKMLYMPAMNAIRSNEPIKAFYERLVNEKHKPKKLALIASMRKLLLIAHSIYKNGTVFSYHSANELKSPSMHSRKQKELQKKMQIKKDNKETTEGKENKRGRGIAGKRKEKEKKKNKEEEKRKIKERNRKTNRKLERTKKESEEHMRINTYKNLTRRY